MHGPVVLQHYYYLPAHEAAGKFDLRGGAGSDSADRRLSQIALLVFETGPEGPELEDLQVEKKSKAAQTRPWKLIRRTCPSGNGSDGPFWESIN